MGFEYADRLLMSSGSGRRARGRIGRAPSLLRMVICALAALSAIGFTVCLAPAARAAVPAIVLFKDFGIRPSVITQGASNEFFDLRWSSWGGSVARARGKGSEGVTNHYHTYPFSLEAFGLGTCRRHLVYTRLEFTNLHDRHDAGVEDLNCRVGQYFEPDPDA
jgi:hypothetical protein